MNEIPYTVIMESIQNIAARRLPRTFTENEIEGDKDEVVRHNVILSHFISEIRMGVNECLPGSTCKG
jgi:hypothetical protein